MLNLRFRKKKEEEDFDEIDEIEERIELLEKAMTILTKSNNKLVVDITQKRVDVMDLQDRVKKVESEIEKEKTRGMFV